MDTTSLMYAIFEDYGLRRRIEAVVRNHWWVDSSTANPTATVPVDALAWAVATNPTVQNTVKAAGGVGDTIADATEAIPDGDLVYIVTTALPRLGL